MTNSIGWALATGQDFLPNHAVSSIDFASIHFWPDNWARTDLDFGKEWMTSHINQSDIVLKKPLIVEEFGKAFGGNHPFPVHFPLSTLVKDRKWSIGKKCH